MKIVYVAGKFAGANDWERYKNVRRAEHLGFAVAEAGAMPLIPHMNTAHFHGTLTDEFWYEGTLELLKRCDAMVLVPGWEDSRGTAEELKWARVVEMPIFERIDELKAWLKKTPHGVYNTDCPDCNLSNMGDRHFIPCRNPNFHHVSGRSW
jgi:hypothetical protein